jgi:hypothetical protein
VRRLHSAVIWVGAIFALLPVGCGGAAVSGTQGGGHGEVWVPAPRTTWQWQLTTPVDQSVSAEMFDIDLFDNAASVVASLHRRGRKVVCYLNAGAYENFRPDARSFPMSVLGRPNGWPGERWLDIRRLSVLEPIMRARLSLCKQKGFDGVEADNVDGYENDTGFPLTAQEQLTYNEWLARTAHGLGLSIALKNDVDQVRELEPYFDYALNEQCFEYAQRCGRSWPPTKLCSRSSITCRRASSARAPTPAASCRCVRISSWTPSGRCAGARSGCCGRKPNHLSVRREAILTELNGKAT